MQLPGSVEANQDLGSSDRWGCGASVPDDEELEIELVLPRHRCTCFGVVVAFSECREAGEGEVLIERKRWEWYT